MKHSSPSIIAAMILFFILPTIGFSQSTEMNPEKDELRKPYHPDANAQADIDSLVLLTQQDGKHIVIQAGGNWCIWCLRFNAFIHQTTSIRDLLKDNFHYYHLNYSPENKNEHVFKRYASGKGEAYGYPFFIVLNAQGEVLTTRESGNLEEGKGYDEQKVLNFFQQWLPEK
ncbi:MAG: thioredoxin family protein [Sphingobacteriaceae bacterium]